MSQVSSQARTTTRPRPAGRPPGATGDSTRAEILDAALKALNRELGATAQPPRAAVSHPPAGSSTNGPVRQSEEIG